MSTPSAAIGVLDSSHADPEAGTDCPVDPHETAAPQSLSCQSDLLVTTVQETREETVVFEMKSESLEEEREEERVLDLPEEQQQQQQEEEEEEENNDGVEKSTTVALSEALQADPSNEFLQRLEGAGVGHTGDTAGLEVEAAAFIVGKQGGVPDVVDAVEQDGAPALSGEKQEEVPDVVGAVVEQDGEQDENCGKGDDQEREGEVPAAALEGVELQKQEVARRSHMLGSLSKLDENSARQLLNDSGWNVSQSTRQNGKTQWYYRSPAPKPVLLGSLTSAVAMWKRLVDEDHKRKGGGDEDLYPMVTAFLSDGKRPTTAAKKRKRGRHSD